MTNQPLIISEEIRLQKTVNKANKLARDLVREMRLHRECIKGIPSQTLLNSDGQPMMTIPVESPELQSCLDQHAANYVTIRKELDKCNKTLDDHVTQSQNARQTPMFVYQDHQWKCPNEKGKKKK